MEGVVRMQVSERVEATCQTGMEPRYRPISQYGVIGDCRTAALIGPDGSIDWCCLPHFDSPAVFCRLLDADRGGFFRVSPEDGAESTMAYLPETNILETTFRNDHGRLRLVDFMPVRHRPLRTGVTGQVSAAIARMLPGNLDELAAERDAGNDVAAAHRITRLITCLSGVVPVELVLKATFDYARLAPRIERHVINDDAVGAILTAQGRYLVLVVRRLHTLAGVADTLRFTTEGNEQTIRMRATLHAGQGCVAALNYARDEAEANALLGQLVDHPFDRDLEETLRYWRVWSAGNTYSGPYQNAVMRSALALKLCTFEPTGAIVAAPTTSLPERPGGSLNWDYRYTWLRDSAFTLGALGKIGYLGEARDYFHFLHDLQIRSGSDLRIMYGIAGERGELLEECELEHLEGYRGSRPVRIGNGAASQRQLDIYGELLDAAYSYVRSAGFANGTPRDVRDLAKVIADYVVDHWRDPDRGIWEERGEPRAFVYSRAMCWAALDRACELATRHGHERHVAGWAQCRDAIHRDVLEHGYNARLSSFTQAYGEEGFDAANFRLPLVRFLPWQDPRVASTVDATKRALSSSHGLFYRYRSIGGAGDGAGGQSDGQESGGREGAFLACALWLVEDLCHLGRIEEAREQFEQVLHLAGPLGLFAEELDPDSGEQLGNYPQAFTHIGLINAAVALHRAQEGTLRWHAEQSPAR